MAGAMQISLSYLVLVNAVFQLTHGKPRALILVLIHSCSSTTARRFKNLCNV